MERTKHVRTKQVSPILPGKLRFSRMFSSSRIWQSKLKPSKICSLQLILEHVFGSRPAYTFATSVIDSFQHGVSIAYTTAQKYTVLCMQNEVVARVSA